MNAKTAKLIRRFCMSKYGSASTFHKKVEKERWNQTPTNKRFALREEMKLEIAL